MVNLVELAARMGVGWGELANVVGVTRQHLRRIQNGQTNPNPITAKRIEILWDEWKDKIG